MMSSRHTSMVMSGHFLRVPVVHPSLAAQTLQFSDSTLIAEATLCICDTVCTSTHGPICFLFLIIAALQAQLDSTNFAISCRNGFRAMGMQHKHMSWSVAMSHLAHDETHEEMLTIMLTVQTCTFSRPLRHPSVDAWFCKQ